jgi:hypothetical protein
VNEGFELGTLECAWKSTVVFNGYSCILRLSEHGEAIETAVEAQGTNSRRTYYIRRKDILIGITELRSNLNLKVGGVIVV